MATKLAADARGGSFLLELLHLAGLQLQVRDSDRARICARRGEVEPSLAEAAATVFARAIRSNRSYRGS